MKDFGIQLTDSVTGVENVDLKIIVTRNENGLITQGLITGNIMRQTQAMIIISNPGDFKFSPTIGASLDELILDDDYLRLKHRIRENLEKDGMKVRRIDVDKGKPFLIEALYE